MGYPWCSRQLQQNSLSQLTALGKSRKNAAQQDDNTVFRRNSHNRFLAHVVTLSVQTVRQQILFQHECVDPGRIVAWDRFHQEIMVLLVERKRSSIVNRRL